jgi:hypothetical protein
MLKVLLETRGWLLTSIGVLGVIFSFLFFGSKADASIGIAWVYALTAMFLCLLVWLFGALARVIHDRKQTVAKIRGVFSASGDPTQDLSFLLDPNESFGSLLKCSVYYIEEGVELYLGGAFVANVQEDKKVQLKISSREPSKAGVWKKIEANDKSLLDNILVKAGERMS